MRPLHGNYLQVARSEDSVYVLVSGQGNMINSTTFKDFVDEMLRKSYHTFVLDLKACTGLDSTFMGLIAGITQFETKDTRTRVIVVNAPDICKRLLTDIGLCNFITLSDRAFEDPGVELQVLEPVELDPKARVKLIHQAHTKLVEIDARNEAKFGAFLKMLTREMGSEETPSN